jgi:thioredoxin 1
VNKLLNKKEFDKAILNKPDLQVVRFCAEWSGPCQMMSIVYREMYDIYHEQAGFYIVDVDEAPLLKIELGVTELPTLFFYKNGALVDFAMGMIARNFLVEKFENALKS